MSRAAPDTPTSEIDARSPSGLIATCLWSRDHKVIGKQFLCTGLAFLVVGGLLALAMRWRLAWPDSPVPVVGEVDAAEYNALFTAHGSVMVFFVVIPLLIGAIGNFVVPLEIGAKNTAWPRLARLSFWLYPAAGVVLLAGFVAEGGGAAAGWTSHPPLSVIAGTGQTCWTVSLLLLGVSLGIAAVNAIATIVKCRAPGMTFRRLPLTVWAVLITSVLTCLVTPLLVTALGALLLDRTAGTTLLGRESFPWQPLFRFWAYPLATLIAVGMASDIISVFARKPVFGYKTLVGAMAALGGLGVVVGGLQMLAGDRSPVTGWASIAANLLIALPLAIVVCHWLGTLWGGSIRFSTPMLFALGFVSMLLIGGASGVILATPALNPQLRGTYFVVAHIHYVLAGGSLFGIFAGLYFWYPKMFGRRMSETLGALHFLLTFVSFHCTFFVMHVVGAAGMPRRYPAFDVEPGIAERWAELQPFHVVMTISAFGLVLAQVLFFVNFLWSRTRGERAGENPWQANTLEWSVSSPPPPDNYPTLPEVQRGPHEYSSRLVAADFLPQWKKLVEESSMPPVRGEP